MRLRGGDRPLLYYCARYCARRSALAVGEADQLADVWAREARFTMDDSRGGLEPSGALRRRRRVRRSERVARRCRDELGMHEKGRHRHGHGVLSSTGSDAPAPAGVARSRSHDTTGHRDAARSTARKCHTETMKLAEKGRFAPPPPLPKHAQTVADALASWPDVHPRTHWLLGDEQVVDGADFYLHDDELGHLHLDGEAHIAVSKHLRKALIASGLAAPFEWSRAFVVRQVRRASDVEPATFLFRLAYDRRRGVTEKELLDRIANASEPARTHARTSAQ